MKKITIYLLMLFSITAFSQVEIIENFDDLANNAVPAGWTSTGIDAATTFACGSSGKSISGGFTSAGSGTVTTTNFPAISNGTDLIVSFSYNIFEQNSQFPPATYSAPAANWGSIVVEYTTDGSTWNAITTIDDSNFTYTDNATCGATANINAGTIPNGSDFQARFVVTATNISTFALWVVLDNVSFTQTATAIPNCDAILTAPLNGSTTADLETTLMWQAATGIPTGYTVSVGTSTGGTDIVNAATTATTNFDLSSFGLTYNTPYYVNIVPFNGIGSATGCTEEMFTTRTAPIAGATCGSPLVVDVASLSPTTPYFNVNDTANFEDNIDVSPCGNNYMSGNDVFYSINPTTDMSVNIELLNVDNNGASIHVVNGCPDAATECVAYVGVYSQTEQRRLENVVLLAGNTYFIVLSNSGSTRTYNYFLTVEQNSCINPAIGTLTPIADCGNGQFSVDVDVTYLGDATSLTLTDDDAISMDVTNITSTGIVTAGPYPSGTIVNFTLTSDQDGTCSYSDSTYFYCPPTNDECGSPIDLTSSINTDGTCTMFTSASNAGATQSIADPDTCASSSNNTNDVWFSFMASSEVMILEYLNIVSTSGYNTGGTIQATELLEGTCGALTSMDCFTTNYVTLTGLINGNTYYIRNNTRVDGEYAQDYDICLKEAPAAPANDECLDASAITVPVVDNTTETVSGTTVGALASLDNSCNASGFGDVWYEVTPTVDGLYEFSIEENPTGQTGTIYYSIYEGSCGSLTAKTTSCNSNSDVVFSLTNGTSYYVMVQSSQINPGLTFDLNVTKLPDAVLNNDCSNPTVLLESTDSAGNNSIVGNLDNSYPSPEACTSSYKAVWYSFTPTLTGMYHFDFTRVGAYYTVYNTDDCTSTSGNYVTGFSCYNSGDKSGDLFAGDTYLISVHISATTSSSSEFTLFAYPDSSLSVADNNSFEAFKYYPNPVRNTLTVEAKNTISNISIYNIVGQQVHSMAPNSLKSSVSMNELNNGVYFVTVTINSVQKTFKIIKK
ncbi:T9SS type A sorting domain-containing protein [Lacinutrix cladophorae]